MLSLNDIWVLCQGMKAYQSMESPDNDGRGLAIDLLAFAGGIYGTI